MNGKIPHLVQYQGSKRQLAAQILQYMPRRCKRLIEPFAGMAAISVAAAYENRAQHYHINDLNAPLLALLQEAVEQPARLVHSYTQLWKGQFDYGVNHAEHFYAIRERFNNGDTSPANMLYLLARCVKGSVRYGRDGKFNQSPDKRRHGASPKNLGPNVYAIAALMQGKTRFSALDYREILDAVVPGDVVYMDPPYQGTSNGRDSRYYAGLAFDDFVQSLEWLEKKRVDYLISYDGECAGKTYGNELPRRLGCKKVLLRAGLSSQALLLGKRATTFESLYISQSLLPHFSALPAQGRLLGATP